MGGCNTENVLIRNGHHVHDQIKTKQWSGKFVDMLLDLNKGQLKFCSPNFIEPKHAKKDINKLNEIIVLDGIYTNKKWCPMLNLKHSLTFKVRKDRLTLLYLDNDY